MKRDYLKHLGFTTSVALLTANKSTMSIICTCGKASGPMCNGADGCPLNGMDGVPAPNKKTWKERLAEEQAKLGQAPTATEVANNLYELEKAHQAIDELKRWQKETMQLLQPLFDYGLASKEMKIGDSITTFILDRCKERDSLKAKGDNLARTLRRLSLSVQVHPDFDGNPTSEWGSFVESAEQYLAEWKGEKEPAPAVPQKQKYYTDEELRDIISIVCDQLRPGYGQEEFIDQTIELFASKRSAIEELRKQGVKHPNPHLCDNRNNCGYPVCECLPF